MKKLKVIVFFICVLLSPQILIGQCGGVLPKVFSDHSFDKLGAALRQQAKSASYQLQISNPNDFTAEYKMQLKNQILRHAMVELDFSLDLKMELLGSVDMGNFIIDNIIYQSQQGVFVTANLYRPKGEGTYPAVITTHGHWANGRRTEIVQTTAQLLALNGFVCLAVDAWGVGERATNPLIHEYHGSNLGASLMNVGNTLLGLQLVDNIRGVDLLCSLPYVDADNIGATGASGGGNQAMWLAAMDVRVKAVVPVVSVGTFESYVMNSNCVCELLPSGMTFTEEDAILGLIAPRALNIFTAMNDANPSFVQSQMMKSYNNALKIYEWQGQGNNISFELFNKGHGYWGEMQMQMLSWFTKHLGNGAKKDFIDVSQVQQQAIERLATYPLGNRTKEVLSTEDYCRQKGTTLREQILSSKSIDPEKKRADIKELLSVHQPHIRKIHTSPEDNNWETIIIENRDGSLIPLLHKKPVGGSDYTLFLHSQGKDSILLPASILNSTDGLLLVDLWGLGESKSAEASRIDGSLPAFHTLSRSSLWLGQPIIGRWVDELITIQKVISEWYPSKKINIHADRETAVAAVLFGAITDNVENIYADELPTSYLFDNRENIDYYNMAIHLPHFLEWGDISLALALTNSNVFISNPKTMSGTSLSSEERETLGKETAILRQKMGWRINKKNTIKIN